MHGSERPPPLSLDPAAAPLPRSPRAATPQSAIIAIPSDWATDSSSSGHRSNHSGQWDPSRDSLESQPMSTSSSSSSSNPIFSWPPPAGEVSHRPNSFGSEDMFEPSSSSSSSGDEPPAQTFPGDRRPSVVFIPHQHQLRSITEPHLAPSIDTDLAAHDGGDYFDPPEQPPRFNRTFSAPLPIRVGSLRHPHSPVPDMTGTVQPKRPRPLPSTSSEESIENLRTPLSTLSLELADSLQSAIQTLLHLSPPHLLDNAKEQYAGCAVQMPTTSLTALLTSMRSLNYLSANVQSLCEALGSAQEEGLLAKARKVEDFDIGELVQNVADLLGGQAAQAGVDLVLFHGDVGIKHVSVNGDAEGLGFLLSHILRQILAVANKGDIIEIGLQIIPQSPSLTPKVSLPLTAANMDLNRKESGSKLGETLSPLPPASGEPEGPILCVFEIIHNVHQNPGSTTATPRAEINPFASLAEDKEAVTPKLDSILCRRLLDQQRASLKKDIQVTSPLSSGMPRKGYELSVLLPRGLPIVEPVSLSTEEDAARQPFVGLRLAREPTLNELSDFAGSLRGKKVFLHASLGSLFARHLSSYLGAWGLDISHIPIEEEEPGLPSNSRHDSGYIGSSASTPSHDMVGGMQSLSLGPRDTDKFIIIDDDVTILRRELLKMCSDTSLLKPRLLKRPTLGARARSTPQIRPMSMSRPKTPVLIHFTSLANYNQVRDVISSVFGPPWAARDGSSYHPEVMVVPKPVGPRRFLTALHTAVSQPMVDPSFSPIATTPRSPGGGYFWNGARTPSGSEGTREGFFDSVAEESPEAEATGGSQKARSPMVEQPPATSGPSTTERVSTPATEYFSASKSSSGASGVIIQSPDGRFGIQFEPPARGERRSSYSQRAPSELSVRKSANRRASGAMSEAPSTNASPVTSPQAARRQSNLSNATDTSATTSRRSSLREDGQPERRRKTLPSAGEPMVMQGRQRSSTITQRPKVTPPLAGPPSASPVQPTPKKKKTKDEVVVPPINVLIVEDNPINQNILSMFLRKKKIKHQAAKDGQEAIEKWRTGGFHLILMDIQLPVMDGITATRHIRAEEKENDIGIYPSTPLGEPSRNLEALSSQSRSSVIIVALTASSLHSDRTAALAAGCNDFLTKPVSLKWLEKKIVEWGCMQALIDFEGWKRWKGADGGTTGDTKRGFTLGPQQAARTVAERLKIERKAGRSPARQASLPSSSLAKSTPDFDINVHAPTPPLQAVDAAPSSADSLQAARHELAEATDTAIEPTHGGVGVPPDTASTPPSLSAINEV